MRCLPTGLPAHRLLEGPAAARDERCRLLLGAATEARRAVRHAEALLDSGQLAACVAHVDAALAAACADAGGGAGGGNYDGSSVSGVGGDKGSGGGAGIAGASGDSVGDGGSMSMHLVVWQELLLLKSQALWRMEGQQWRQCIPVRTWPPSATITRSHEHVGSACCLSVRPPRPTPAPQALSLALQDSAAGAGPQQHGHHWRRAPDAQWLLARALARDGRAEDAFALLQRLQVCGPSPHDSKHHTALRYCSSLWPARRSSQASQAAAGSPAGGVARAELDAALRQAAQAALVARQQRRQRQQQQHAGSGPQQAGAPHAGRCTALLCCACCASDQRGTRHEGRRSPRRLPHVQVWGGRRRRRMRRGAAATCWASRRRHLQASLCPSWTGD